jgi:DNA transformation protein
MFGGHGFYRGDVMFGLVLNDALFLRADAENRDDFVAAGMPPFQYDRRGKVVALAYHEVPADLLEDQDELARWADKAYAAALRVAAAKRKPAKADNRSATRAKQPIRARAKTAAKRLAGDAPPRRRIEPGE